MGHGQRALQAREDNIADQRRPGTRAHEAGLKVDCENAADIDGVEVVKGPVQSSRGSVEQLVLQIGAYGHGRFERVRIRRCEVIGPQGVGD